MREILGFWWDTPERNRGEWRTRSTTSETTTWTRQTRDDLDKTDCGPPAIHPKGRCCIAQPRWAGEERGNLATPSRQVPLTLPLPNPRPPPHTKAPTVAIKRTSQDPFHPYRFSPPGTLYAPRRTGHKGREDLRLLHLQARRRILIHPAPLVTQAAAVRHGLPLHGAPFATPDIALSLRARGGGCGEELRVQSAAPFTSLRGK